MAEVGFGNPGDSSEMLKNSGPYAVGVVTNSATVFDQGFGDKTALFSDFTHVLDSFSKHETDTAYQFTGFGDPTPDFIELPVIADGISEFPDEGGVLITLEGTFDKGQTYHFQLIGQDGTVYPSATTFCSAAKAGQTNECKSYRADSRVRFAMPPVPPGVYDIKMFFGVNKSTELNLSQYVKVMRKNRSAQGYSVRSKFPEFFSVGARNYQADFYELGGTE